MLKHNFSVNGQTKVLYTRVFVEMCLKTMNFKQDGFATLIIPLNIMKSNKQLLLICLQKAEKS